MLGVSTVIPGYALRTEMIRNFFPFPLWKISERLFRNYGTSQNIVPKNSGLRKNLFGIFREKVPEKRFWFTKWKP